MNADGLKKNGTLKATVGFLEVPVRATFPIGDFTFFLKYGNLFYPVVPVCRRGGMVDTIDSKSIAREGVRVQVSSPVWKPFCCGFSFFSCDYFQFKI